jgi:AP-1-like factor
VALQTIARKLKEENESLLLQNRILKETISGLQGGHSGISVSPSRPYVISSQHLYDDQPSFVGPSSSLSHDHGTPGSLNSGIDLPPSGFVSASKISNLSGITLPRGPTSPAPASMSRSHSLTATSRENDPRVSVLDNLPAYHPPIPLPWSGSALPKSKSIFPVFASPQAKSDLPSTSPAKCSGDPANCAACADDAFGREFCQTINDSAYCADYLDRGVEEANTSEGPAPIRTFTAEDSSGSSVGSHPLTPSSQSETIPTNEAWCQLKAHPNVDFSDLALLADVVVRQSQRAGSYQLQRLWISSTSDAILPGWYSDNASRHTACHETERRRTKRGDPRLAALDGVEYKRRRIREVRTDAVKSALLLLDAKYRRA